MNKELSVLAAGQEEKTNMLAKVVKKSAAQEASISYPSFRQDAPETKVAAEFVVPSIEDIKIHGTAAAKPFVRPIVGDVIQNAKDEAAQIITQAENNKEIIEQAAHEKGMLEVQKLVDEQVEQQISDIRENLSDALEKIASLNEDITEQIENDLVKLSLEIAKKIVGREVNVDTNIALDLVKISLKRVDSRAMAEVRLHPDDHAFIQGHREDLGTYGSLKLVEDNSISKGGCLIHTETGDVDARIESQFEEIAKGLLKE